MNTVRFQLAVSVVWYVAGPDQSQENPQGVRGMELHEWVFELEASLKQMGLEGGAVNASIAAVEEAQSNFGADLHFQCQRNRQTQSCHGN